MSVLAQKREALTTLYVQAQEAANGGNLEAFEKANTDLTAAMDEVQRIEVMENRMKVLSGDFNRPTNAIPLTSGEARQYDPKDSGAKYLADYRPPGYCKEFSPAIQTAWVREQMGDNLKDQARFYRDTWTKWFKCRNKEAVAMFMASATPAELKAMDENTDAEGGYFVPEEYRTIVLHDPGAPGGLHRPYCTALTTGLKDGYFPTFGSVTWAAISEGAAYGDNTPAVGQVPFTVAKSGGTVKISMELLEDSMTNVPALISQVFNEARGRYEDAKIISGSGSNEPEGLRTALGSSQTVTMANATSVVAADIVKLYFSQPAQFRGKAIFSFSSSAMLQIISIGATAAGIHFAGSGQNDGVDMTKPLAETLLGRKVLMYDGSNGWDDWVAIASAEVGGCMGDFSNYFLIDRIGMSIRRDDSIYVANDQVGLFARARFDGRVGVVAAFRLLKAA